MKKVATVLMFVFLFMAVSCGGEEKEKILCPDDNIFCNEFNGVNWSDKSDTMDWNKGKSYCDELGGRLPTVSELRTLIKKCPETMINGKCELTDTCLTDDCRVSECLGCDWKGEGQYSVFGDDEAFWTSSLKDKTDDTFVFIGFYEAKIGFTLKSASGLKVRCLELFAEQ